MAGYIDMNNDDDPTKYLEIIAQRVYELFIHDRMHTGTSDLQHAGSRLEAEMMIEGILDMTEWLKSEE